MREPRKSRELRSRYLAVTATTEGVLLTFAPRFALTLGLPARAREARRRVKAAFRAFGIHARSNEAGDLAATIAPAQTVDARRIIAEIDGVLDGFARDRVTPRMVEQVLGITTRERLRWTKDGRLPKSGAGSFKRGPRVIYFPLHPAHKIAAIAADPSVVAGWRKSDGERPDRPRTAVL